MATLAYRGGKALRGAPPEFATYRVPDGRPAQILAHICDLFDWALHTGRRQARLAQFDAAILGCRHGALLRRPGGIRPAAGERRSARVEPERLFQGPIADALTHVGQIAMLRRMAGCPIPGENYFVAKIETGRVGADQAAPVKEF